MKAIELVKHRDALRAILKQADALAGDPELLGHWARYTCVLCAGLLENAVRILYSAYAANKAHDRLATYVTRQLDRVQNPKASRFVEVATSFDKKWGSALDAFLNEDAGRRKNAIDSIMSNRHLIAHGRSSNISLVRLKEYLDASLEVVDFIEAQCDN